MHKILLVEGITDLAFVKYILYKNNIEIDWTNKNKKEYRDVNGNFTILNLDGIGNLLSRLKRLKNMSLNNTNKIGIILDADDNPNDRKQETEKIISDSGVPADMVSYFLIPNDNDTGNLETLLMSTIPDNNQIKACFLEHKKCLNRSKQIYPKALDKGELYTYTMFSQKGTELYKPEDSFYHTKKGETGLWDISNKIFNPISQFILNFIEN